MSEASNHLYKCDELGCYFRLNGKVLESAPMYKDGTVKTDEFGEREIDDSEKFMFQGKKRTIASIEKIIIKVIRKHS